MATILRSTPLNIKTKYWDIKVIKEVEPKYRMRKWKKKKITIVEFVCHCWNKHIWPLVDLKRWRLQSCWCSYKKRKQFFKNPNYKHWLSHNRFERIYMSVKSRCNNPNNKSYKNYWWRWIKCLWKTFEEFKNDMYDSYLEHIKKYWENNTTIERIDVNWHYCKENCRWATLKEQSNNRRNNKYITYNWETQSLACWCNELWLKYTTIRARLRRWRSIEKAFSN